MHGTWSPGDIGLHINLLELRAVKLTCMTFLPVLQNPIVQILMDNIFMMRYIIKKAGAH